MIEKLALFNNASFIWQGREYEVKNTKCMDLKACIYTNRQTFIKFESELDQFINEIKFIQKNTQGLIKKIDEDKELVRNELIQIDEEKGVKHSIEVYHAEIMDANNRAIRISDKLEEAFNDLSEGDFDEKKYKKAESMVKLSNAIVANEMMRFKFLTLK